MEALVRCLCSLSRIQRVGSCTQQVCRGLARLWLGEENVSKDNTRQDLDHGAKACVSGR